jgi:hypothetical protein
LTDKFAGWVCTCLEATESGVRPQAFSHDPLDTSIPTLRLVRIIPGKANSTIGLELKHQLLCSDHVCLSYAREEENDNKDIVIYGKSLVVRRNLLDFLHLARKYTVRNWLWIDAICINQNDVKELNHQIQQMSLICSQAKRVLIRTGAIFNWQEALSYASNRVLQLPRDLEFPTKRRVSLLGCKDRAIMESEYWRRMWILQVIGLGRLAEMFVGQFELDFKGVSQF